LPADGRIHTVDVCDVAAAFVSATTTSVSREVFLIGGDDTHRTTQCAIGSAITAAMGLGGGLPPGRNGEEAAAQMLRGVISRTRIVQGG
jgi:uncharacterized protein YbjT (DUF2867 family)